MMRVVTYHNFAADAPAGHQAVALIFHADNKPHPVMIFGVHETAAREKAETWLAAEIEKARPKDRKPPKKAAAPAADDELLEAI